jgi:Response regulator receiver domain
VLLPRYRVQLMIQQGGRMFMFQARPSVRLVEIDFSFSYVERPRTDACVHARPPTRGPLTSTEKVCETVVGRERQRRGPFNPSARCNPSVRAVFPKASGLLWDGTPTAPARARGAFPRPDVAGARPTHSLKIAWNSMAKANKILIIDDDLELRDALTEQLSLHEEFEAVAVENGSKGVQTAKADQIDLVIMDVGLPDIDGREACASCARTASRPLSSCSPVTTPIPTPFWGWNREPTITSPSPSASPRCWRAFVRNCAGTRPAWTRFSPSGRTRSGPVPSSRSNPRATRSDPGRKRRSCVISIASVISPVPRETLLQEVWGYNSGVTTHTAIRFLNFSQY